MQKRQGNSQSLLNKIREEIDNLDIIDWEVFITTLKINEFVGNNYPKQKKYEYKYDDGIYICNLLFEFNNIKWYINIWRKDNKEEFEIPFSCIPILIYKNVYTLNIKINNKYLKKIFNSSFQTNYKNILFEQIRHNFISSFSENQIKQLCNIFRNDAIELNNFGKEINENYETYKILRQIEDEENLQNAIKMFALFYNIEYKKVSKHNLICIFEES